MNQLNLGCGTDARAGFVNVDFRQLPGVDLVVDLSQFPWPFENDSVDKILMLDFLEHFPYRQTERILLECHRILKADGEVTIQVPDGEHLMMALACAGDYLCNRCGGKMLSLGQNLENCPECKQSADDISDAAMMRLYGGQDYTGNFHQTCFTSYSLERKARAAGFTLAFNDASEHFWKNWSVFSIFKKGDIW